MTFKDGKAAIESCADDKTIHYALSQQLTVKEILKNFFFISHAMSSMPTRERCKSTHEL